MEAKLLVPLILGTLLVLLDLEELLPLFISVVLVKLVVPENWPLN